MDPISLVGLAASAGALIQLTGKVIILFTDYVSSVKGAGASVDQLKVELTAVSGVLMEISNLAANGVALNPAVTAILTESQKTLQTMLEEMTNWTLKSKQAAVTSLGIRRRIKWSFREKKIRGWIVMLESHKATISLHLQHQTL